MRRALETDDPMAAEDFSAAMDVVARLAAELKPLQEEQVKERR